MEAEGTGLDEAGAQDEAGEERSYALPRYGPYNAPIERKRPPQHDVSCLNSLHPSFRAAAAGATSEQAAAAGEGATSDQAAAAGAISFKCITDMYTLETMPGGIITVEADNYMEVRGNMPFDFTKKTRRDGTFCNCYGTLISSLSQTDLTKTVCAVASPTLAEILRSIDHGTPGVSMTKPVWAHRSNICSWCLLNFI